jgi:CRP-like cAMP-binding protein
MFTELLNFFSPYISLTPDDLQLLSGKMEHCSFKKKENLIEIGEVENYVHLIKKGLTRRFFYVGKTEFVTQFVKEGAISMSAASFLSLKPSKYTIEAMEPVETLRISKASIDLLYTMDNKWESVGRIITAHFLLEQEKHILDGLRLTVRQRFVKFVTENPELVMRVPQKYLASYLNIKQETFSRMKHLMLDKSAKQVLTH